MTTYIPSITIPHAVFSHPASAILLPVALGTSVGFSMRPTETQKTYMALKQPPLRPSPAVFGPVWTALYASMGYASYRAYTTAADSFSLDSQSLFDQGATLFTIQLGLNLAWMPLFFKFKRPIEATVDIIALTGVTGALTYCWGKVDKVAGWCLAPYLGWLCFATYLCAGAGHLNGWDFSDKESDFPPSTKSRDTKYVDERE